MITETECCLVDVGYCDFRSFLLLSTCSDESLFNEILGFADCCCLISVKAIGNGYFGITMSFHHVFVCVIYQDGWERAPFSGFLRALQQMEQMETVFLGCYDHLFLNERFGVAFQNNVRRTAVVRQRFFSLRSFYMKHEMLGRLFTHEAKKTFVGKRREGRLEVSLYQLLAISFDSLFAYIIEEKCIGFEDDVNFLESLKTVLPQEECVTFTGTCGEELFELTNVFTDEHLTEISLLGVGGQGTVSLAFHEKLYHLFALKMYHSLERTAQLVHEYDCLCRFRHPCVVHAYGYLLKVSIPCGIVLEYCVHGSVPYDFTCLSPEEARRFVEPAMGDVAFALDYVNCHGYVHGDVKEGNVLLSYGYHGRLSDFGSCMRLKSPDISEQMDVFEQNTTLKFWQKGKERDTYLVDSCMLVTMYHRILPYTGGTSVTVSDISLRIFPQQSCIKTFLPWIDILYTSAYFDRIKYLLSIQSEYMKKTTVPDRWQFLTCLWRKSDVGRALKNCEDDPNFYRNLTPDFAKRLSDAISVSFAEILLSDCVILGPDKVRTWCRNGEVVCSSAGYDVYCKLLLKGKYFLQDTGQAIEIMAERGDSMELAKLYIKLRQYEAALDLLTRDTSCDLEKMLLMIKAAFHVHGADFAVDMASIFPKHPRVTYYVRYLLFKEKRDAGRLDEWSDSERDRLLQRKWPLSLVPRDLTKVWKLIEIAKDLGCETNESAWLQLIRRYVDFANFLDNIDMSVECRTVPGLKSLRKFAIAKGLCEQPDRPVYIL